MTSDERKKLAEWFFSHDNLGRRIVPPDDREEWARENAAALLAELSRPEAPPAWTLERQAALSKRLKEWFPHYRDAMELIRDAAADIGRDFCKQAEAPPAVTREDIRHVIDEWFKDDIYDHEYLVDNIIDLLCSRGVNVGGE